MTPTEKRAVHNVAARSFLGDRLLDRLFHGEPAAGTFAAFLDRLQEQILQVRRRMIHFVQRRPVLFQHGFDFLNGFVGLSLELRICVSSCSLSSSSTRPSTFSSPP